MRRVRYNVAASLDGYIAGPKGEFDWIPEDSTVDFGALFAKVDTVLLGRRSYEVTRKSGGAPWSPQMRVYVFSRTLQPSDHPDVAIVSENAAELVARLRAEPGTGEIWLFGGGELFRTLLAAGQVDSVEVTVVPVLLGGGVPLLLPEPAASRVTLTLVDTRTYPSGMVTLSYLARNAATSSSA